METHLILWLPARLQELDERLPPQLLAGKFELDPAKRRLPARGFDRSAVLLYVDDHPAECAGPRERRWVFVGALCGATLDRDANVMVFDYLLWFAPDRRVRRESSNTAETKSWQDLIYTDAEYVEKVLCEARVAGPAGPFAR